MSGIVEIGKDVLQKSESPPPTDIKDDDDPNVTVAKIEDSDVPDASTIDSDATENDATKEKDVESDKGGKCESEEDSSKEVDKSEKKTALEKNGWTMVEKYDFNKGSSDANVNEAPTSSVRDQDGFPSYGSQVSTISSVNSDGIPIRESLESSNYIWSKDGEQAISEEGGESKEDIIGEDREEVEAGREDESPPELLPDHREDSSDGEVTDEEIEVLQQIQHNIEDIQENAEEREDNLEEREDNIEDDIRAQIEEEDGLRFEDNQVTVDEEDDGLRLNFFARLLGDLYPSQELDDDFAEIRRGEVYKHNKNFHLNSMLTAAVILVVALAIGLGIGHFLGMLWTVSSSININPSTLTSSNPTQEPTDFGANISPDEFGAKIDPAITTTKSADNQPFDAPVTERPRGIFSKLIGTIKNSMFKLASKLGYIKKQSGTPASSPSASWSPVPGWFQCMIKADVPVLVHNNPVWVRHPQDCHQFYLEPSSQQDPPSSDANLDPDDNFGANSDAYLDPADDFGKNSNPAADSSANSNLADDFGANSNPVDNFGANSDVSTIESSLLTDPVFMEVARDVFKSDDQDLDDRVIKSLWMENQELREQIQNLRTTIGDTTDSGDEAMSAVLRDRINSLLTANADLEREVARLRYAHAARGAAESVETLAQLRKTRDTLNSIVDENDQLKIQVAKTRYSKEQNINTDKDVDILDDVEAIHNDLDEGIDFVDEINNESKDATVVDTTAEENVLEETTVEETTVIDTTLEETTNGDSESGYNTEADEDDAEATVHSTTAEATVHSTKINHYDEPKESNSNKRKEYMKKLRSHQTEKEDENTKDNEGEEDDDDDNNDDYEHPVLKEFSRKLSKSLSKIGSRVYNNKGNINWGETSRFFGGLQADMVSQLSSLGVLTEQDLSLFTEKFSDLRNFVSSEIVAKNYHASKKTSEKLLKSLINGVKDLQDAAEEAAENSAYGSFLKKSVRKIKNGIDNSWKNIKKTFKSVVDRKNNDDYKGKSHNKRDKRGDNDDDDLYDSNRKRGKEAAHGRDWEIKRGKARESIRQDQQKGEWIFDRSKERDHQRKEERRGDWYSDRKERRQHSDQDGKCHGDDCKKSSKDFHNDAKYIKGKIHS